MRRTLKISSILIVVAVTLFFCLFTICPVVGVSMLNTLEDGDYVLVAKFAKNPTYGDVVIFSVKTEGEETMFVKRVIGKGGDIVEIRNNQVTVNGVTIDEPYLYEEMETDDLLIQVPPDSFFVLGDNRNRSVDSRFAEVGCVSRSQLRGKVYFKF